VLEWNYWYLSVMIIFGLGFTGERLARRLLQRGLDVSAAVRGTERFRKLADKGLRLTNLRLDRPAVMPLPRNSIMALLIPPLPEPENTNLRNIVEGLKPKRVVYVSSTGVYGDQINVDEGTPAAPNDARGRLRLEEEHWISSGPWSSLILRAAGIYGPNRGVHAAIREGKLPRSAGSGIVSRIHVEDLAAIVEAGMLSDVTGTWPVADDLPCPSEEIGAWCANLLGLRPVTENERLASAAIPGRKVDGRRIREVLAIQLQYPSWKAGIAASLLEEKTNESG
jgi:nucleoside-diphosphate-sugar epimerase